MLTLLFTPRRLACAQGNTAVYLDYAHALCFCVQQTAAFMLRFPLTSCPLPLYAANSSLDTLRTASASCVQGNTAVYLEYAHARIAGIARKVCTCGKVWGCVWGD